MTRKAWVLALALAAIATPAIARAEDWRVVPGISDHFMYVDADSIERRADGRIAFRAVMRPEQAGAGGGYDRVDLAVRTQCGDEALDSDDDAVRAAALGRAARLTVLRGGRRVTASAEAAESIREQSGWLIGQVCRGELAGRRIATVEALMQVSGRIFSPSSGNYESAEVELTGIAVQGFEANWIELCGSEDGCSPGAQTELCWLEGNLSVPLPPGARPEWNGGPGGPPRYTAAVRFRGKIQRSPSGTGFGHMQAAGCQVVVTGPVTYAPDPGRGSSSAPAEAGARPAAVSAYQALLAALAEAGPFAMAAGAQRLQATGFSRPDEFRDVNACRSYARAAGGSGATDMPAIDWTTVRSVVRRGAEVRIGDRRHDENLTYFLETPSAARQLKRAAEGMLGGRIEGVEQTGRRVTVRFAGGGRRPLNFADAGQATRVAGLAWQARGQEIADVRQSHNRLILMPARELVLTFANAGRAEAAAARMETLRAACAAR
jgi:hypothetical protein